MRKINKIVIHHSASSWGSALVIDKWHKEFDPPFDCIGYQFVISNGMLHPDTKPIKSLIGNIEAGRDIKRAGAHVKGHNKHSIGICLIHDDGDIYNDKMFRSLFYLCKELMQEFSISSDNVVGHGELDPENKALCPGFDMIWFRDLLKNKERWNFWDIFCVA